MSYIGYSHSENYEIAYAEGKRTLSQISENLGLPSNYLKHFISSCEWHHTSKCYNKTYMYDLEDDDIKKGIELAKLLKKDLNFLKSKEPLKEGWVIEMYNDIVDKNENETEEKIIELLINEIKKTKLDDIVMSYKAKQIFTLGYTKQGYEVFLAIYEDEMRVGFSKTKRGNYFDKLTINNGKKLSYEDFENFITFAFGGCSKKKIKAIYVQLF